MEWLNEYQKHVEEAIEKFLSEQYPEQPWAMDQKTFREALLFAIRSGTKTRIHPILAMIVYEELLWITAEAGLFAFIGLEFIYTGFSLHLEMVDASRPRPLLLKHDMISTYGEPMTLLVGDALSNLGIDCLSKAGKMTIIREIMNTINSKGMVEWIIQDLLVDYAHFGEKEYISIHDEMESRLLSSSLVIGALFAGDAPDVMVDQLRRLWLFLGRAHQIGIDIALYEENTQKWISHEPNQYGVVDFLWIDQSKQLFEKLGVELINITTNFRSSKFEDIVHLFLERKI